MCEDIQRRGFIGSNGTVAQKDGPISMTYVIAVGLLWNDNALRFSTNNERTSNVTFFPSIKEEGHFPSSQISVGASSSKIHVTWIVRFAFAAINVSNGDYRNNTHKEFVEENKTLIINSYIIVNRSGYLLIGFSNNQETFMNCYRTESTNNSVSRYGC